MAGTNGHMIVCVTSAFTGESEVFAPGLLRGQVALVTGGGTGLGKATALELVRCGASTVIAGRRGEVLEGAAADIRATVGAGRGGADGAGGAGSSGRVDWIAGDVRER